MTKQTLEIKCKSCKQWSDYEVDCEYSNPAWLEDATCPFCEEQTRPKQADHYTEQIALAEDGTVYYGIYDS